MKVYFPLDYPIKNWNIECRSTLNCKDNDNNLTSNDYKQRILFVLYIEERELIMLINSNNNLLIIDKACVKIIKIIELTPKNNPNTKITTVCKLNDGFHLIFFTYHDKGKKKTSIDEISIFILNYIKNEFIELEFTDPKFEYILNNNNIKEKNHLKKGYNYITNLIDIMDAQRVIFTFIEYICIYDYRQMKLLSIIDFSLNDEISENTIRINDDDESNNLLKDSKKNLTENSILYLDYTFLNKLISIGFSSGTVVLYNFETKTIIKRIENNSTMSLLLIKLIKYNYIDVLLLVYKTQDDSSIFNFYDILEQKFFISFQIQSIPISTSYCNDNKSLIIVFENGVVSLKNFKNQIKKDLDLKSEHIKFAKYINDCETFILVDNECVVELWGCKKDN